MQCIIDAKTMPDGTIHPTVHVEVHREGFLPHRYAVLAPLFETGHMTNPEVPQQMRAEIATAIRALALARGVWVNPNE